MNKPVAEQPRRLRCAIYTRKSSEEGLDQEYNSLDAQRDAGEAYIASQKHEGWMMVPEFYDDGGFSGGNLERPALKRLLDDNLDIESAIDSETLSAADLRAGVWDGATVEIFLVNWSNLANGKIILKRGTIGEVELKDTVFRAELRGLSQALSQQIVELYTPDCRADLGDMRCKVNLAALTVTGAIAAVTDRRGFTDTSRVEAANFWNGGLLTWTSGANVGRKMEVKAFASGGIFTLFLPMPSEVTVGDTYSLRPGCDKKFSTCKDRYNNVKNFRGEPNVPGNDQVLAYPDGK